MKENVRNVGEKQKNIRLNSENSKNLKNKLCERHEQIVWLCTSFLNQSFKSLPLDF